MSKRPAHERDQAILDLLDGHLPEDQQAELRAWLDQSPEHYDRFVELSFLHSQLAEQLNSQRSSDDVRLESLSAVPFSTEVELPPIHLPSSGALTKQQYASAMSYVLRHTLTPKRVAIMVAAAAVLLGVVLTIVIFIAPDDEQQITAIPDQPKLDVGDEPIDIRPVVVAMLTAEHDAAWDRRPGQDLYAGQRFTLNEGLAEITTRRGAVVILEAPATIELLTNDNAIHLQSGKLVGICEARSSKGFTVHTPHMDIIDLGTRFGVDVSEENISEVHVLEGEVVARLPLSTQADLERRVLTAGQALAVDDTRAMKMVKVDASRFTSTIVPGRLRPRVTGAPALWSPEIPGNLQATLQQSDSLQIYLERHGHVLQEDTPVNVLPGETAMAAEADQASGPRFVAAGNRVSVYIIHLDSAKTISEAEYSIQFNEPILGVICKDPFLHQTDQTLGSPKTVYPDIRRAVHIASPRGIDFGQTAVQGEPDDSLRCDEHKLHLTLSQLHYVDQIRVLVKDPQP